MKIILFFFLFPIFSIKGFSQNISDGDPVFYTIASVYNFKTSILSITFDDGVPTQFTIAVPLLNERKIPATFYVVTSDLENNDFESLVSNAYLNHHEIGSHTVNHLNLTDIGSTKVRSEVSKSQKDINTVLNTSECLTISYPFGVFNDSVVQIANQYYIAARSGVIGYNDINVVDKFRLKTHIYLSRDDYGPINYCAKFASRNGLWEIETLHGVENVGYEPMTTQNLIKHLDLLKSLESNMWLATVSSVIKYLDEKNSATLNCFDCDNGKYYKLKLNDNLNDSVYDQPLSIYIEIPENWDGITISGAKFVKVEHKDGNKFLYFNALPNNQEIQITAGIITKSLNSAHTKLLTFYPNPFIDNIDVYFETNESSYMRIQLSDIFGRPILFKDVICEPINKVRLSTGQIPKGAYILEILNKTSNERLIKKLVKIE